MGLLDKLFRRNDDDEGTAVPISLDVEARRTQLRRFEQACDALTAEMRSDESRFDLPGWKERMNEYNRVAGTAMQLRQGTPTREGLIDLAFEVRPVFTGPIPAGYEAIGPLQDEVMAAARELQEVLPGER
ncbi:hypothetical protein FHX74_003533 [Friedmanniella endophytica]|uniref:Uncharacterized protein n=1 Tax=Microlunatus kandeliicorticis TaxID=1759536 RepID=A0A7W3IVA6_9ACTN|nr:hypothetical protein [Microlunatus kandeliicorticis]MBA8795892.1 hypothetical protein [Microlunatus kandeliicorticis]